MDHGGEVLRGGLDEPAGDDRARERHGRVDPAEPLRGRRATSRSRRPGRRGPSRRRPRRLRRAQRFELADESGRGIADDEVVATSREQSAQRRPHVVLVALTIATRRCDSVTMASPPRRAAMFWQYTCH